MGRHTLFSSLALTAVWVILVEEFSWQSVAVGMFMGMLCMHFIGMFLRFQEIEHVNFYKLVTYPFWLVGRIYMDAIFVIRMIFANAKWGITTEHLNLDNEVLRIMLAESITLTPGSIFIVLKDKDITLLCLGDRNVRDYPTVSESLHKIENILLKAEIKSQ